MWCFPLWDRLFIYGQSLLTLSAKVNSATGLPNAGILEYPRRNLR